METKKHRCIGAAGLFLFVHLECAVCQVGHFSGIYADILYVFRKRREFCSIVVFQQQSW